MPGLFLQQVKGLIPDFSKIVLSLATGMLSCATAKTTTESFESILFVGAQSEGTRELYRLLNSASKEYKAGSILLVVDPAKQDSEKIAHLQAVKQHVNTALEPLTHQEVNFLHNHYATIANFSNIADKEIRLATDPVGKYFEIIGKSSKRFRKRTKIRA